MVPMVETEFQHLSSAFPKRLTHPQCILQAAPRRLLGKYMAAPFQCIAYHLGDYRIYGTNHHHFRLFPVDAALPVLISSRTLQDKPLRIIVAYPCNFESPMPHHCVIAGSSHPSHTDYDCLEFPHGLPFCTIFSWLSHIQRN